MTGDGQRRVSAGQEGGFWRAHRVRCARQKPTDVGDVDNRLIGSISLNRPLNCHPGFTYCGEGCGDAGIRAEA